MARLLRFAIVMALLALILYAGLHDRLADTPERAIYALAHAVEKRDAKEACKRTVPTRVLGSPVEAALRDLVDRRLPTGAPAGCGVAGDDFQEARVRSVRRLSPTPRAAGVTDAAIATVRFVGGGTHRIAVAEHRGRWKVVTWSPEG